MIQVNRIYLIFNRLVTKKFLVDTSVSFYLFRVCLNFVRHEGGKTVDETPSSFS
jgi:hypothetical protein